MRRNLPTLFLSTAIGFAVLAVEQAAYSQSDDPGSQSVEAGSQW